MLNATPRYDVRIIATSTDDAQIPYRFEQPIHAKHPGYNPHEVKVNTYLEWLMEENSEGIWYASTNRFFKLVINNDQWAFYINDNLVESKFFDKGISLTEKKQRVQKFFTKEMSQIN